MHVRSKPSHLETFEGIAFPPIPIRVQSIRSPASRYCTRPTTRPFSEATTCRLQRVHAVMPDPHNKAPACYVGRRSYCDRLVRKTARGPRDAPPHLQAEAPTGPLLVAPNSYSPHVLVRFA